MNESHIEAILNDFRAWLMQSPPPAADPPGEPPPDLHTLLGQMIALRQEVNLQTRATRTQQEQNAEALARLGEALEALRRREEAVEELAGQSLDEQLRPILKTLVDLHDALSLARREVQRVQDVMASALDALAAPAPALHNATEAPAPERRSFWSRLFGRKPDESAAEALRHRIAQQQQEIAKLRAACASGQSAAEKARQFLGSLVTGYTMGLQRIERALAQHGLEAVACLGEPFDPETMEAVEVVSEPGRAGTEVVEEVRRGYRWRDRVFRFAQVKVAKP